MTQCQSNHGRKENENQERSLPVETAKRNLENLLKMNIHELALRPVQSRYSKFFVADLKDTCGHLKKLFIKEHYKESTCYLDFDFFKNVLEPYGLNSPYNYGIFSVDQQSYIVMDFIDHGHHLSEEEKYFAAVDWLVRKDSVLVEDLPSLSKLSCIELNIWGPEQWLGLLHDGVRKGIHPKLNKESFNAMYRNFRDIAGTLTGGRQTVCHNDFGMYNILFTGKGGSSIYVIDWTRPTISSVCVDLAFLVNFAPPQLKEMLLNRYRASIEVGWVEDIYNAALHCVRLCRLGWMTNDVVTGKANIRNVAEEVDSLLGSLIENR